ncbi:MAG: polysaccharide deacetylase family protein [Phycisphaerales bacterium]|nr:MAG: polysaccharide deacetylase family protein [Phycisphaerales bacterium]
MRSSAPYAKRDLLLRIVYLAMASTWWFCSGFGLLIRTRVVTLCYHGVTDGEKDRFRWQMELIAGRAITTGDLDKVTTGAVGPPRVCVTFDDAFANLLGNALPVTTELGIPATVFAVTENLGSRPRWQIAPDHPDARESTMTADQIRAAARNGLITFGSHGATHRPLAGLPAVDVERELVGSREVLEEIVGGGVEDFAFPHGECDAGSLEPLFDAGYRRLFTLDPSIGSGDGPCRLIGRMPMSPQAWEIEFRLTAAGAYEWLPHLRKVARRIRARRRRPARAADPEVPAMKTPVTGCRM